MAYQLNLSPTMTQKRADSRWWQRLAQQIASSRVGARVLAPVLHHIDRVLMRVSRGQVSIPETVAGLPVVRLTTIGAKTGKKHTVPVVGLGDGEKWILIASNWGSEHHPSWYHNLRSNSEVALTNNDQTNQYIAHEATGRNGKTAGVEPRGCTLDTKLTSSVPVVARSRS